MSQTFINESSSRRPRVSAPNAWTRFVHAVDSRLEPAVDKLLLWQRRHKDRQHLLSLDDRLLRDIGISCADVENEASKPFWRP